VRSLLDISVLIALLDADHTLHPSAIVWFSANASEGWASCPITENGCVRVMSHPGYANTQPAQRIVQRLRSATADPVHEFWPDAISLLDPQTFDVTRIHGPRQLTDLYLLALAVSRGGRLVTFDAAIASGAVPGAKADHLLRL